MWNGARPGWCVSGRNALKQSRLRSAQPLCTWIHTTMSNEGGKIFVMHNAHCTPHTANTSQLTGQTLLHAAPCTMHTAHQTFRKSCSAVALLQGDQVQLWFFIHFWQAPKTKKLHNPIIFVKLTQKHFVILKSRVRWKKIGLFRAVPKYCYTERARNVKMRYFLSRNVKICYILSQYVKIRAISWKLHKLRYELTPHFLRLCPALSPLWFLC